MTTRDIDKLIDEISNYLLVELAKKRLAAPQERRMVVQLGLVERLKYFKSMEAGQDIGWQKAHEIWVERYAARFADVYVDGLLPSVAWKLVVDELLEGEPILTAGPAASGDPARTLRAEQPD